MGIKLSVSTFSAGHLFASGKMDLEGFVRAVSGIGYTGIELVGGQLAPGYPYPPDPWIEATAALLDRYGVEMVAYGGYVDLVRYSGRDLTDEEIIESARNEIVIARRLGARVLKTGEAIGADNLRALLPDCERWGVWIGLELHFPQPLANQRWGPYLELFREDGGVHFGFVPDAGIFQRLPHEMFRRECLESGVAPDRYAAIEAAFAAGKPLERALAELALSGGEAETAKAMYVGFSGNQLADLDTLFRYSRYTHGKYFYLDEHSRDRGIAYPEMVAAMKRQGYDGYVSAEYEGYFHDVNVDAVEQLERFYTMMTALGCGSAQESGQEENG